MFTKKIIISCFVDPYVRILILIVFWIKERLYVYKSQTVICYGDELRLKPTVHPENGHPSSNIKYPTNVSRLA